MKVSNCTATRTYTSREMILAEREAFYRGYVAWSSCRCDGTEECRYCRREAAEQYPLPNVRATRVVSDRDGVEWKVEGDRLYWRRSSTGWYGYGDTSLDPTLTPFRVSLWADLFRAPNYRSRGRRKDNANRA